MNNPQTPPDPTNPVPNPDPSEGHKPFFHSPDTDIWPELRRESMAADPIAQFEQWFTYALGANVPEPTAMTLATADNTGRPSARIVLLKSFDQLGFLFFTNYESRKARELAENPQAALVFFWPTLQRQIRVMGRVAKVSEAESDEYFHSRPRGSQIGAWASTQSKPIPDREWLNARVKELTEKFGTDPVPLPPFWGGYRLTPDQIEFWQARVSRLHDRFLYTKSADGGWRLERLSP